ncbi:MAG: HAD-IA family hydrolase [Actinomycetota bacterium]|nr:HAD-IA family hydrolase [Actinomycetota bacterium]
MSDLSPPPAKPRRALGRFRAVIFDVDGTLVDSERDGHRVAFNRAFAEAGIPDRWDPEEYGRLLAVTGGQRRIAHHLAARGMPRAEAASLAAALHRRKTEIFAEMVRAGEIAPRQGVPELLDALRAHGVTVTVATTGTGAWVRPLLDRLFGPERFAVVVTADEEPALKPDPAAYRMVISRLGIEPVEAIAVEDSANGLRAARAAGLTCLVVSNDYTSGQDFAGAAAVFGGFGAGGPRSERLDYAALAAFASASTSAA